MTTYDQAAFETLAAPVDDLDSVRLLRAVIQAVAGGQQAATAQQGRTAAGTTQQRVVLVGHSRGAKVSSSRRRPLAPSVDAIHIQLCSLCCAVVGNKLGRASRAAASSAGGLVVPS